MTRPKRRRLSPAMIVVVLVLIVAIGGFAVALGRALIGGGSANNGPVGATTPFPTATGSQSFTLPASASPSPSPSSSGPVYDVTSYGAVGDGTTDDSAAVQAAYNAAQASANQGNAATVLFPSGRTYYLAKATVLSPIATGDYWNTGTDAPGFDPSSKGVVTFSGYGATIKYASGSARYCWLQAPHPCAAGKTYGDLVIEGFAFAYNGRAPAAECGSLLWISGSGNASNITLRDLTTDQNISSHMSDSASNNPKRNVLGLVISGSNPGGGHFGYASDISVIDCNVTCQSQCFFVGTGNAYNTPYVIDQVNVSGCTTNNLGFAGSSMMLGGGARGWRCSVVNTDCSNVDDDGVEIDAFDQVTIEGCSFHRIRQAINLTRFSQPYKTDVTPTITIDHCNYSGACGPYWQQGQSEGPIASPMMPEMRSGMKGRYPTPPNWGDVVISNCTGSWTSYSQHHAFFTLAGPMHSLTITGCSVADSGQIISVTNAGSGSLPVTLSNVLANGTQVTSSNAGTYCHFSGCTVSYS